MNNMYSTIEYLKPKEFPRLLREIPQPPKQLNYRGTLPEPAMKLLSVVGSRKYTNYGKQVVGHLISGLRGHNIGIVSGLALGIDSLAHQAALDNHLYTLAIPGGGLSDSAIYPATHKSLAKKILEAGGGLLSEYDPDFKATTWSFPERNRLVSGISHATLVIEAGEKSGSLITARLTADYNRELLVVPGSIFSDNSKGTHQFMKLGARPVTEPADILDALGLTVQSGHAPVPASTLLPEEQRIIDFLSEPKERDLLIRECGLPTESVTIILMQMEMNGLIKEAGGVYRKSI
jgi:DNA processing protein